MIKLRNIMVATVIFAVLITGTSVFYSNLFNSYGKETPETLNTEKQVNEMNKTAHTLRGHVSSISQMNVESIFSFIAAIPNAISLLAGIPVLISETITGVITPMPADIVPDWATTLLNVTIIIIGVMLLISAIQKYRM